MIRVLLLAPCLLLSAALSGSAEPTWDALSEAVFGDTPLIGGHDLIAIQSPYRTDDDSRTVIGAVVSAPAGAGLARVTLILDENPMPVSAVFRLAQPQPAFSFEATLRINGPTPLHIVAEMADGRHFFAETFVKTSGQGACAAPPGSDPEAALATLGEMLLEFRPAPSVLPKTSVGQRLAALSGQDQSLDIDVQHPSHSGMQMDQISLLFIPMLYVETLTVDLDGAAFVDVTGSISLSENPRLSLSVPKNTQRAEVTMTDTDGTITTARTALPGY